MVSRLRRDWLDSIQSCIATGSKPDKKLSKSINDGLVAMSSHFGHNKFVLGDEFTLSVGEGVLAELSPREWLAPRGQFVIEGCRVERDVA